ncbi:MAG: hypothetical protein WAK88_04425, partial [Candidatus Cybelea sp.]
MKVVEQHEVRTSIEASAAAAARKTRYRCASDAAPLGEGSSPFSNGDGRSRPEKISRNGAKGGQRPSTHVPSATRAPSAAARTANSSR